MNDQIDVLRRLQSIDSELKRLEDDKIYRARDIQKKQNAIEKKKTELANIKNEIKELQKKIGIKELDLKTLEAEIEKLRIRQNQVKTNKEFSAIKIDITGKEADKSVIEDEILAMISKSEEAQQKYSTCEKEIEQDEAQLQDIKKQVEKSLNDIDTNINELKDKHNKYATILDPNILQQYERLISHKDTRAVVGVVNKVCQGCFMSTTSQTLNRLMSGKDLTFCHSCGRILYLENGSH